MTLVGGVAPTEVGAQEDERSVPKPFLIALDRESGEEQWRRTATDPGIRRVLGEADGLVYVHDTGCGGLGRPPSLVAFDARSGDRRWRRPVQPFGDATFDFSVGDDTIVIAGPNGSLQALDPVNGRVKWEEPLGGFAPMADLRPVAGTDELVLLSQYRLELPRELRGIDRETGEIIWISAPELLQANLTANITVVRSDTAILEQGGPEGGQTGIDLGTGQDLWRVPAEGERFNRGTDWGLLFAGSLGALRAYAPRSQTERWVAPLTVSEVTAVADGVVLTSIYGPPLRQIALDARTGEIEWERESASSVSIEASGRGLVLEAPGRGVNEDVVALDVKTGKARWEVADPADSEAGARRWIIGTNVYTSGGCAAEE